MTGLILATAATGVPCLVVYLIGARVGRQARKMRCSCGHSYAFHSERGKCNHSAQWYKSEDQCRCIRYDGRPAADEFERLVRDWKPPK